MIEEYLRKIDEFISSSPHITAVQVVRRSIWDTDVEKIAIYRYRLKMSDESPLELTERIIEEKGVVVTTRYRYHWQTKDGKLIKRWDNAPHHPEIDTFPNHVHNGSEIKVSSHKRISRLQALELVTSLIEKIT